MKFLFVDDSGNRGKKDRWFCLGGVIVEAEVVPRLKVVCKQHRSDNGLPAGCELKFADVGRPNSTAKKPNPLVDAGYGSFNDRAKLEMQLLNRCLDVPGVAVIATAVKKAARPQSFAEDTLELMVERFTLELQRVKDCGVIVCDQENSKHEEFRATVRDGSWFIREHPLVAETIMFVPSHFSPGVQLADTVAGGAARWWNHDDRRYADEMLRGLRQYQGRWRGAGMKSIPDHYPPDRPPSRPTMVWDDDVPF